MLLVSLTGSAFGAGTFASFTATTTNAGSTFASGSLVLTAQKGAGNTCFSNNTVANGAGTNTDTNANAACDSLFTAALSKPGDLAVTQPITITNAGSLAATSLKVYSPGTAGAANCTDAKRVGETFWGTGSMCETLQMSIHDDTSNLCVFGGGSAQAIKGGTAALANASSTVVITGTTNQLGLNVAGAGNVNVTIDSGTWGNSMADAANTTATNPTLATKIQKAIDTAGLAAVSGVGPDGVVYIAAANPGATLVVTPPAANSAGALLGFGTNAVPTITAVYPATQAAACAYSPAHNVMAFARRFTSGVGLTATAAMTTGTSKIFTVGLNLDTAVGNHYQGRLATFGLTWAIAQ